jgi:hypothetical protein
MSIPASRAALALAVMTAIGFPFIVAASAPTPEQTRDAAFERMFNAPTDRGAMLDYARASIALRDFEAAMAVLERLVALEPDNAEARRQLAMAYFALGSNVLAEQQLLRVAQSGDAAVAARAEPYLRAAADRAAPSQVSGSFSLGGTASSNDQDSLTETRLTLSWRQDLGTAAGNYWLTNLSGFARRYDNRTGQPVETLLSLRSGPVLRIGPDAESPVLQPYAFLMTEKDIDSDHTRRLGLGAVLRARVGQNGGLTGDLSFGQLDADRNGRGHFTTLAIGGSYRLSKATMIRLQLAQDDRRGLSAPDEVRRQATMDIWHSFRPAFTDLPRDWRVGAILRHATIDSAIRDYQDTSVMLAARMWLTGNGYVETALGRSRQKEAVPATSVSSNWITLRLGWEF